MTVRAIVCLVALTAFFPAAYAGSKVSVFHFNQSFLGVEALRMTGELRQYFGAPDDTGVLVARVLDGTPAEDAGVEVGDVLIALNGTSLSSIGALRRALAKVPEGEVATLTVIRNRTEQELSVTPEAEGETSSFYRPGDDAHFDASEPGNLERFGIPEDVADDVRSVVKRVKSGDLSVPQVYVRSLREREAALDSRLENLEQELRALREKLEDE